MTERRNELSAATVASRVADRLVWYNRNGRQMSNGITWFRFPMGSRLEGWGLWWKDTRIKRPAAYEDAPERKYRVGPYRVALLRPKSG